MSDDADMAITLDTRLLDIFRVGDSMLTDLTHQLPLANEFLFQVLTNDAAIFDESQG